MSTFGTLLKLTTFGESHALAVGGILEGFPPNFHLDIEKAQNQVNRRRAVNNISTERREGDEIILLSGVEDGITLGTPLGFMVKNLDIKKEDYSKSQKSKGDYIPRPGHADFTYLQKYGIHAKSGGGRSSARETVARVVAGAFAEQYLEYISGCTIVAWVNNIGGIKCKPPPVNVTRESIDKSEVRCPDLEASDIMIEHILKLKEEGNSAGGIISCGIRNPPIGIGEPCFDKLEARLAMAMMSIPATKGFEIGEGFGVATLTGKDNNDCYSYVDNSIKLQTNHAGGTLGGISTGSPIYFKVAVKPPSSIRATQHTCNMSGEMINYFTEGRHDPCVVHRAIAIVESMAALTLLDYYLIQLGRDTKKLNR